MDLKVVATSTMQIEAAMSQDVWAIFSLLIQPTWASDKQAKMVFAERIILQIYSIHILSWKNLTPCSVSQRGVEVFCPARAL